MSSVFELQKSNRKQRQERERTLLALLGFNSVAPGCLGISNLMLRLRSKEGTNISPEIRRELKIVGTKEQRSAFTVCRTRSDDKQRGTRTRGRIKESHILVSSVSRRRKYARDTSAPQRWLFKHKGPHVDRVSSLSGLTRALRFVRGS